MTVITPTYNRAEYVKETIDSVLAQDYPNIEFIIIDDGSSDNTREILREFENNATIIYQENTGENATVNKGFSIAKGDYICVVNSDDPILPNCIGCLVGELEAHPQVLVAYGDWAIIGPDHEFLKHERLRLYTIENMLETLNFGLGPGTLIRKSAIEKFGGRLSHYQYAGDMEFYLRMSLVGPFVHVPQILATHRHHTDSLSVQTKKEYIAREMRDAFKRTFANRVFPGDLRRSRWQYIASIYDVCRKDYATSKLTKVKFWTSALLVRLFEPLLSPLKFVSALKRRAAKIAAKVVRKFAYRLCDIFIVVLRVFVSPGRDPKSGKLAQFAFSTRFLPPLWSGQAVVISRLLRSVDHSSYRLIGHPVAATSGGEDDFIGRLPGKYYELPPVKHIPVLRMDQRIVRVVNLLWGIWQRAWHIVRELREDRPLTLIGCTGDQIDPPATWLAAQLLRSRFCLYYFDDYGEQWWADRTMLPAVQAVEAYIVPRSQILVAPNEFMRDKLRVRFGQSCEIIRNPMPASRLPRKISRFPVDGKTIKLVFTGAVYHLNYQVLRNILSAISTMSDLAVELHIYTAQPHDQIAGEGIEGARVSLRNHARPDEAVSAQRKADILLIPFNNDPACTELVRTSATAKLADYLATGRPILALCPQNSFLSSYLKTNECGVAIPGSSIEEIQAAIRHIALDADLRDRLQKNARKQAKADFNPQMVSKQLMNVLGVAT